MAKNGYFQLIVKGGDTYALIIPPIEGGAPVDVNRLTGYLDRNLLNQYDLKALAAACKDVSNQTEVRVGMAPFRPFNECMEVDISLDKMLVFCRFYPPSEGGDYMYSDDIVQQLMMSKVKYGIDQEAIDSFLGDKEYNKDYILAKGKPPRQGTDAKVQYHFNTSPNTKPKRNPNGTVDYHDLNTVSMVREGQVLATLIPADKGEDGCDVYGNVIKPRSVKEVKLEFGNNITLSEDRMQISSDVIGHATLNDGKVFVSDVLDIPADVDTSTGDIHYEGAVLIHGNVKSGFVVEAKGDVVIEGVVEGAKVISDGQIVIKQGIHGMNKGSLEAKGSILCKFIENATVNSGGYIETEGILHSKVSAYSEIRVHGKKSIVVGGVVRAGSLIEVEDLGSEMGTATLLEVGIDPSKKAHYNDLQKAVVAKKKELDTIKPILASFSEKIASGVAVPKDKLLYVQKLAVSFRETQTEVASLRSELEVLHAEIMNTSHAKVKVLKTIYQGVTITISDVSLTTKNSRQYCQFVKDNGEVTVKNL